METRNLYALLVGINSYPDASNVQPLIGCVNDITKMDLLLKDELPPQIIYQPILLINYEATRERVIREFRSHLGKATSDDIVLFMFCGHGARQQSDPSFQDFYPDGEDETLVCYNSRLDGGLDLADKELAVLLEDVLIEGVHGLVILDCCHAGSGTRTLDEMQHFITREAGERKSARHLESYLDGHYVEMLADTGKVRIPSPKYILLAACNQHQRAFEHFGGYGLFSNALLSTLSEENLRVSYAQLYQACRATIMRDAAYQTPQFETVNRANAHNGFLDIFPLLEKKRSSRIRLIREAGVYHLPLGVLHGLQPDKLSSYQIEIYPVGALKPIVWASLAGIGLERSQVCVPDDMSLDKYLPYEASLASFSVPAAMTYFEGPEEILQEVSKTLPTGFVLSLEKSGLYGLQMKETMLHLQHLPTGKSLSYVDTGEPEMLPYLIDDLRQITIWRKIISESLSFQRSIFPVVDIDFGYVDDRGRTCTLPGNVVDIRIPDKPGHGEVFPSFNVSNQQGETLFFTLVYLSPDYGIHFLIQREITSGPGWVSIWGGFGKNGFYIPDGEFTTIDTFAIVVSSHAITYSELAFPDLIFGQKGGKRKDHTTMFPQQKWAMYGAQFVLSSKGSRAGTIHQQLGNGSIELLPNPAVSVSTSILASYSPAFFQHPAQIGSGLLLKIGGGASLFSFGKASFWDYDTLCLSDFKGLADMEKHPLTINLHLNPSNQNAQLWCVCYTGIGLSLLAEQEINNQKETRICLRHLPPNQGSVWIWFFMVKEGLAPEDFGIAPEPARG